nr:AIR synthase related protein [Thermoanaerobaculia bacterium]
TTPELASKEWIWGQYDYSVRTNTVAGPGGDAAVLRLKGSARGLALSSDVNPGYCWLDPRTGGAQAVAEAVRNLAMAGAEPLGLTDCLNFGNPERPEISWQLAECIQGMSEACRALEIPVVSGNVSLYNETEGRSIHPTPTVAAVGLIPEVQKVPGVGFEPGCKVVLLGKDRAEFGGSAYLRLLFDLEQGLPPRVSLEAELRLSRLMRELVAAGLLATAHDLAEGGLAVALAECCFARGVGARLAVSLSPTQLFSESQARAVVACRPEHLERLLAAAERLGVPAQEAGETGGERLWVAADGATLDVDVAGLRAKWASALPLALGM